MHATGSAQKQASLKSAGSFFVNLTEFQRLQFHCA